MENRKFLLRNASNAWELNKEVKAIQIQHSAVRSELKALEASNKVQSIEILTRENKLRRLNKWDDFRKRREEAIIRYCSVRLAGRRKYMWLVYVFLWPVIH